jgi:hypothetical protein
MSVSKIREELFILKDSSCFDLAMSIASHLASLLLGSCFPCIFMACYFYSQCSYWLMIFFLKAHDLFIDCNDSYYVCVCAVGMLLFLCLKMEKKRKKNWTFLTPLDI